MASIPGRLTVGSDGRLHGPANLTYNTPFPCPNGSWGSGSMNGVVMHTMVGNLPGTIAVFNNPTFQASAHFGISQTGEIHQFGPIGKGWIAWAQEAGNGDWYSIEHADNGNPDNPLTPEQVRASAQVVECLSRFAGFPLTEANTTAERGYGVHYMGGAAWGGHTCPDEPPAHVRSRQRPAILALATEIRSGVTPPNPKPDPKPAPTGGDRQMLVSAELPDGVPVVVSFPAGQVTDLTIVARQPADVAVSWLHTDTGWFDVPSPVRVPAAGRLTPVAANDMTNVCGAQLTVSGAAAHVHSSDKPA